MIKKIEVFFWERTYLKHGNVHKVEEFFLRAVPVSETMSLLVNFSMKTAFSQPILLIFRPLS